MQDEVQQFLAGDHSVDEYKQQIHKLLEVQKEVSSLDDVLWFHMFRLECHDIKHGLREILDKLVASLVQDLAHKHLTENARCACLS